MKSKIKRREQKKRYRERQKTNPPELDEPVILIDFNESKYPIGYCWFRKRYLTQGLADTHRCIKRGCKNYEP